MKTIATLVILIVLAAVAYTAYGVASFEPQKPAALVFNEPSPETLKSLGIYEERPVTVELTPEQKKQKDQAINKITDAMKIYQGYGELAGQQLKGTISLLNSAMAAGRLPAYFLTVTNGQNRARSYQTLSFDPANFKSVEAGQQNVTCAITDVGSTDALIGDDGNNAISCSLPDSIKGKDQIFLGGPGDDVITDDSGNRIINAGTGNDTIKLGPGRTIIVLEDGWGQDNLTMNCTGGRIENSEIPSGFPIPWIAKTTNFIVLSPRINAASVEWQGNTLKSTNGDSLTINDNCFTLISAEAE